MSASAPAFDSPAALGLRRLALDPQFPRIEPGRREVLVAAALEDGCRLAREVRGAHGDDPDTVARACAVRVAESDEDAGFGSTVVFAVYEERPPAITLYRRAIDRLDRCVDRSGGAERWGIARTRAVFLAHELYHHFDCAQPRPLAARHRVRLFGIGSRAWTSGLASLPEIAAGAFARELLGLRFHPAALEDLLRAEFERRP